MKLKSKLLLLLYHRLSLVDITFLFTDLINAIVAKTNYRAQIVVRFSIDPTASNVTLAYILKHVHFLVKFAITALQPYIN